jgi:group I intron endonuclease
MNTIIYTLADPISGEIRYIGKTIRSLEYRLKQHLYDKSNTKRINWIKSLKKKGLLPIIEELEECTWENSSPYEIYWISQFRTWGFNLTNMTEGGDGYLGLKFSEEVLKTLSEKQKHWQNTHVHPMKGKKRPREFVERTANNRRGKKLSGEALENVTKGNQGRRVPKWGMEKGMELHKRKIVQLDRNHNFINEFNSILEAFISIKGYSKSEGSICKCCKGKQPTAFNYIWKYKEDYDKYINSLKKIT